MTKILVPYLPLNQWILLQYKGKININDALPQAGTARATTNVILLVAIGGSMVRVLVS